ncbi:hypothetical protein WG66_008636 [Moniliophthora roreri]|uniref:Uncharacterized protein n=1 Tax=Moniliophthora roreri TaxID=221103 RepID=A0A0W0FKC3_MONRR|nr:hypothetical protein WG66_008636 [Moniliophthora roreri]
MSSQVEPSPGHDFLAVVFVFDTSFTLQSTWAHVLHHYIANILKRLGDPVKNNLRIGIVTYSLPEMCPYTPVVCKRFFGEVKPIAMLLKEKTAELGIGSSSDGGKRGMAALDGIAAAVEMVDLLNSCVNHARPIVSNIVHITAAYPDDSVHPQWNDSDALDNLTWESLPSELSSRNIYLSTIVLNPEIPVYSTLHSSGTHTTPWFQVVPHHKLYLSGYFSSPALTAPKRPAELMTLDQTPESKRPRLSETPSNSTSNIQNSPPKNPQPPRPLVAAGPGPGPGPVAAPSQQPQRPVFNLQMAHAIAQRIPVVEQQMKNLDAQRNEAIAAGDNQKAESLHADIMKARGQLQSMKSFVQMQVMTFKQMQAAGAAPQAQQPPAQQPPAQGQTNVPPPTEAPQPPTQPQPAQVPPGELQPSSLPPNVKPGPSPSLMNRNSSASGPTQPPQQPPILAPTNANSHPGVVSKPEPDVPNPINPASATPVGGARLDIATQMQKLVEQSEKSGRPQPPIGAPPNAVPGQGPSMMQNAGSQQAMGQNPRKQSPSNPMMPNLGVPFNNPDHQNQNQNQNQVPVWQGIFIWPPDNINGMREIKLRAAVVAMNGTNESRAETWPQVINLKAGPHPISINEIQAWITSRPKEGMFLGRIRPHTEPQSSEAGSALYQILGTKKFYVLAQWTTPTGQQRYTALITAAGPLGLIGVFFPMNGFAELPKSSLAGSPVGQPPPPQPGPVMQLGGPGPGLGSGPGQAPMAPGLSPEVIAKIRNIPDTNQRVIAAHNIVVRFQQMLASQGRNMGGPEMQKLMTAMNVTPQQFSMFARAMQSRMMQQGGMRPPMGQPGPGPGQQQQPGMPDFGGGGGMSGPPQAMMGGGGVGGMFNPMVNGGGAGMPSRGIPNMNMGQGMMNPGFQAAMGAGMNGAMGGFAGNAGMQGNISMEMMQSFAQRNGMGQGPS